MFRLIVISIFRQWQIQGRGPGGGRPPLSLDQGEARRAEKMFFGDRLPPPPLSQGLDQALLGGDLLPTQDLATFESTNS